MGPLNCLPIRSSSLLTDDQDIPLSSYVPHRINVWVAQLCYTLALSSVKISVLLFYRRLSVSFNRSFIIAVWIGIVYNVLYCLAFVLALCLLYRPLQAYWLTFDPVYYVKGDWSSGREEIAVPLSALFSVTGDAYATILPLILVHGLSLPRRQKWALYALFSLGIATIVFGALRTYWIWRLFTKDWDFTWSLWKAWLFGELEIWSAVYAASAPALKPFFKRYFDRRRTHAGSNGGNAVYVVRGDSQGKLGKVEKLWVSSRSRRSTVPSSEEEDVELVGANGTNGLKSDGGRMGISPSHIVKQVEYDVERCVSANAEGVEALPAWERRWPLQRSGSLSVASGPLSRRAS